MLKKVTKTGFKSLFLCIILVGVGVFLFIIDNERRHVKLTENNIHIVLSESDWTKDNYELTIKYDGLASRHIKGYSFDGGKTWSKRNIFLVEDNQNLEIAVKDVNEKIYSLNYEIKNIDREGPKIEVSENIQVKINSTVNLEDYVTVIDEGSGLRDEVVFTPNKVDTSKLGEQKIQIYAIDKMANKTISEMTINVVNEVQDVKITKLSLEDESITMNLNEENQLVVTYEPKYASASRIKWSTSDENIVQVDSTGKISAKGSGTATITASVDDQSVTCEIIVQ